MTNTQSFAENVQAVWEKEAGVVVRLPAHSILVSLLRDLIIEGEITRDDQLSERVLCERFRVSRSPIREAIRAIAAEGLLEIVPNCGARIARITRRQLMDLQQILAILESAAAREACDKASDAEIARIGELHFRMLRFHALGDWPNYFRTNAEIHYQIIDAAGNAILSETYRKLDVRLRPFRYQFHFVFEADDAYEVSVSRSLSDHVKIFEAMSRRDKDGVAEVISQHYNTKEKYLDYWVRFQESQATGRDPENRIS
jgi:DNA-binding GntR family transcriptional regulator